jgi:cyanophycinase
MNIFFNKMKMKKIIVALMLVCVGFGAEAVKPTPKGKLFIIGGGSRPDAMIHRLIQEASLKTDGYAVVLPMSSEEPDSAVYYTARQFKALGMERIYGLNFIKGEPLTESKLDSIRHAKLIYISGGDQNKFMNVVLGTSIEKAIKEAYQQGAVIAGTSAGAAVMSKVMITGRSLKKENSSGFVSIEENNLETTQGLGMLETVIIDQHFVRRSRYNRLITAVIEFPTLKAIGIEESTAILVVGKNVEVVGEAQVVVIDNPKRSKSTYQGKLGARDMKLQVYLPGEKFRIK